MNCFTGRMDRSSRDNLKTFGSAGDGGEIIENSAAVVNIKRVFLKIYQQCLESRAEIFPNLRHSILP